jgi:hypothetical protein
VSVVVRMNFETIEDAAEWFQDARYECALPAEAGLRWCTPADLELSSCPRSMLVVAAPAPIAGSWVVRPGNPPLSAAS